jgi:hypothetical protein
MNPEHIAFIDESVQSGVHKFFIFSWFSYLNKTFHQTLSLTAPLVPTFEVPTANFATAPPRESESEDSATGLCF